jgi:short-subunit dehydrogenase involved in D-alanine esterification of teichoic acids
VFEIIPPTVDTDLDKGARNRRKQKDKGISASEVAPAVIKALEKDEYETAIGMAEGIRTAVRSNPEQIFQRMNQW